jgi:hypothetical protein
MDELSTNLVIGAVLGFTAMIICAFGDMHADKKYKQKLTANKMDSPAKDDILEN